MMLNVDSFSTLNGVAPVLKRGFVGKSHGDE